MNRKQKIQALQDIASGKKSISEAFPPTAEDHYNRIVWVNADDLTDKQIARILSGTEDKVQTF